MDSSKVVKWVLAIIFITILVILYKTFNPNMSAYFPKCPFKVITTYQCPGCGSQRAVHYLLNFDIANAARENLLLVISIPYILIGFIYDSIETPNQNILKWRKRLFGTKAILIILPIIIGFWIIRNITC